jgi:glutamate decarboxylase
LTKGGKFQIMNKTQRIPVVALTVDKSVKRYNEFDISNKVRERGWILAAYSMPPDAQEVNSLRIVVRPHLNRNVVEILYRRCCALHLSCIIWRRCRSKLLRDG